MQPGSYESMTKALAKVGLVCRMRNENQLIVSLQQGPVWPNRGNSFWLSYKGGDWYLSTWLPATYRIPAEQDVGALCSAYMRAAAAMYRVPHEVMAQFKLQEIDEREYESLFGVATQSE